MSGWTRKRNPLLTWCLMACGCLGPADGYSQASPSAYTTGYRYSLGGLLTGVIQPYSGSGTVSYLATRNTYNAAGLLATVEKGNLVTWQSEGVDPASWTSYTVLNVESYTYDSMGRMLSKQLSSAGTGYVQTQYSYDIMGRQQCSAVRMNPAAFGSVTSACTLNAAGSFGPDRITSTTYDAQGRTLTVQKATGTSSQQTYATYTYTPNGLQHTVKDANGNLTTLIYDGLDRISETQFPSKTSSGVSSTTDIEQYSYDSNSNRKTLITRSALTIGYNYDGLNRLIFKDIPGGNSADVYYSYDLRGLQTSAMFGLTSGAGASTLGVSTHYDGFGRVDRLTNSSDGISRQLSYSYDANGNRLTITHPDNAIFVYGYDQLNRMQYICESASPCTSASNPVMTLAYDDHGRPAGISAANGAASTGYLYDPVSRLQTLSVDLDGVATTNDVNVGLTYSPATQVITRSINNGGYVFATTPSPTISYASNGLNQYSSIIGSASVTPAYDANANMTFDGSVNYSYDAENRLVSTSGAKASNLTYDPNGRLLTIDSGTGTSPIHFMFDGDSLIAEYNSSNALQARYVHGPDVDEPLVWYQGATISAASRFLAFANHQGSVVALTNSSGTTTQLNTYNEYGIPATTNAGRFQYTGQVWLPQVGLYYYRARMYSPQLGRFMQTDPIGYKDNLDLYAYVGNDPFNKTDPTGQCPQCAVLLFEGVEAAVAAYEAYKVTAAATVVAAAAIDIASRHETISNSEKPADKPTEKPSDRDRSRSNPPTGQPGSTSSTTTRHGKPKQDRVYGDDGYPDKDVDHDHAHDGIQPHVHDWDRPPDGSPPAHDNRQPGREPKPGEIKSPEPPKDSNNGSN